MIYDVMIKVMILQFSHIGEEDILLSTFNN